MKNSLQKRCVPPVGALTCPTPAQGVAAQPGTPCSGLAHLQPSPEFAVMSLVVLELHVHGLLPQHCATALSPYIYISFCITL